MKSALCLAGISAALLVQTSLSLADEDAKKAAARKEIKLEACELGSTYNVHRFGKIYLAGQPSADDFVTAKKEGIKTVINLRTPGEMRFDEKAVLKDLGLEYHYLPFAAPDTLKDEIFEKSLKVLGDRKKQPVLLHCASANRVGAIWLAHRVLTDKVPYDKALKEAKDVGLRSIPYEGKARDYIRRTQAESRATDSESR